MSLVHSLGITLWTFVLTTHTQACGVKEDNVCITAPHLLVTTPSRKPSCGRPALMHRHTELSTAPIHGSSTASKQRQQQQQGLSTQSTGPMTMTRPQRYGLRPEYLGTNGPQDERLNIETSTLNPQTHQQLRSFTARCWPTVSVALGSIRTSVMVSRESFCTAAPLPAPMHVEGRVTDEVSG
jgi:hypothetical protein